MDDTTPGAITTDAGTPPAALTFADRAARLREMADTAPDYGGLRDKLAEVASFAEAVAARLDQIDAGAP